MSDLQISSEVDDYFLPFCFDAPARAGDLAPILTAYEAGKVIVLQDWALDFDRSFFAGLDLESCRGVKKLKSVLGSGLLNCNDMRARLIAGGADATTVDRLIVEAQKLAIQIAPVMERIFKAKFLRRRFTWRLQETTCEALHIDAYQEEQYDHVARLFVNLDTQPRLWNTSHRLPVLLDLHGHLLTDDELRDDSPGTLCRKLSNRIYGDAEHAGLDGEPRHIAIFAPGDIWLVDSRKVSHQIVYGRRALSVDYTMAPSSMASPQAYYLNAVETYRSRRTS